MDCPESYTFIFLASDIEIGRDSFPKSLIKCTGSMLQCISDTSNNAFINVPEDMFSMSEWQIIRNVLEGKMILSDQTERIVHLSNIYFCHTSINDLRLVLTKQYTNDLNNNLKLLNILETDINKYIFLSSVKDYNAMKDAFKLGNITEYIPIQCIAINVVPKHRTTISQRYIKTIFTNM